MLEHFREIFPKSFTSALGLQSLVRLFYALVIPIIGGILKEKTGDFRACLLYLSTLNFVLLAVWFVVAMIKSSRDTKMIIEGN